MRQYERYAVFAAIVLLLVGCYLVVRPFLTAFLWGAILSLSTRGLFEKLRVLVGGRRRLAATLAGLTIAAVLFVPITAFAARLAGGTRNVVDRVRGMLAGGLREPPAWLASVPIVGGAANAKWQAWAADPELLRRDLRPLVGPAKDFLVAAAGGVGAGILEFALAVVIAGFLYVRGAEVARAVDRVALRLGGETGRRQVAVVRSTVRGVFRGLLGTCAVQAVLAMIGFWIAGVPGVFVLGMATFFLSVIPMGPALLWLPAALWLGANDSTGHAIFLAIWSIVVVGGAENVVRPILIGKGVDAPMALIFLGVVGGILAFGFLGLFIGPTLLAVAYNLVQEWMRRIEAS
ncbi:MAG TPA: AI-2E family transporter [Thermoanaerobaculia bacterium]|nr:AI-2E family transporter [Thermoanaerobaculia bacterium]